MASMADAEAPLGARPAGSTQDEAPPPTSKQAPTPPPLEVPTTTTTAGGDGAEGNGTRDDEVRELARRSEAAAREALKKRFFDRTEREIESIDNFVAPLKFFAELRPECRRELCETLGHATVAPGEVFVRQKGAGNTAYVVLDGTCNIWRTAANEDRMETASPTQLSPRGADSQGSYRKPSPRGSVVTISPTASSTGPPNDPPAEVAQAGDAVCEAVLFDAEARNPHTAAGATPLELLVVERQAFQRMLASSNRGTAAQPSPQRQDGARATPHSQAPRAIVYTKEAISRILSTESDQRSHVDLLKLETCLTAVTLFQKLKRKDRLMLGRVLDIQVIPPKSMICVDGEVGNCMYVIIDGRATVHVKKTAKQTLNAGRSKPTAPDEAGDDASATQPVAPNASRARRRVSIAMGALRLMRRNSRGKISPRLSPRSETPRLEENEVERMFGRQVQECKPGMSFGELALQHANARRSASVYAPAGATLICISREDYNLYLRDLQRLEWENQLVFLRRVTLLDSLSAEELTRVIYALRPSTRRRGEAVFEQGEELAELRLIGSGEVKLLHTPTAIETRDATAAARDAAARVNRSVAPSTNFRELATLDQSGLNSALANSPKAAPLRPRLNIHMRSTPSSQHRSSLVVRRIELAVVGANGFIGEESLLLYEDRGKKGGDPSKWRTIYAALAEKQTDMYLLQASEVSRLSNRTQEAMLHAARNRRAYREDRIRELLGGVSRAGAAAIQAAATEKLLRPTTAPAHAMPRALPKTTSQPIPIGMAPPRQIPPRPGSARGSAQVHQASASARFAPAQLLLGSVPADAPSTLHINVPGAPFHERPVSATKRTVQEQPKEPPPILVEDRRTPAATLLRRHDEFRRLEEGQLIVPDPTSPMPEDPEARVEMEAAQDLSALVNTTWHVEADPMMYDRQRKEAAERKKVADARKLARAKERAKVPQLNLKMLAAPTELEDDDMRALVWQQESLSSSRTNTTRPPDSGRSIGLVNEQLVGQAATLSPKKPTGKNTLRDDSDFVVSSTIKGNTHFMRTVQFADTSARVRYNFSPGPGVFRSMSPYRNLAEVAIKSPRGLKGRELMLTSSTRAQLLSGGVSMRAKAEFV